VDFRWDARTQRWVAAPLDLVVGLVVTALIIVAAATLLGLR
jgi:hypothetical protein